MGGRGGGGGGGMQTNIIGRQYTLWVKVIQLKMHVSDKLFEGMSDD